MKTLKIKKLLFNLLTIMAVAVFLISCEQENIIQNEITEKEMSFLDNIDIESTQSGINIGSYEVFEDTPSESTKRRRPVPVGNCCQISSHQFEPGFTNSLGDCFNNSVYRIDATNAKIVQYSITQTQYIDDNNINTFTLNQHFFSTSNSLCVSSVVAIPYFVMDLPGINIINSNMWIYDQVNGVCAHMSDSYIVDEPCL